MNACAHCSSAAPRSSGSSSTPLRDELHAALQRDAEIAVAECAVGLVQRVEVAVRGRPQSSDRRDQRGAIDAHPTLQNAQSHGAFRSVSSSSSSLAIVNETPAISIDVA